MCFGGAEVETENGYVLGDFCVQEARILRCQHCGTELDSNQHECAGPGHDDDMLGHFGSGSSYGSDSSSAADSDESSTDSNNPSNVVSDAGSLRSDSSSASSASGDSSSSA